MVQVKSGCEKDFEKRFDFAVKIGDVDNKIIFTKDGKEISTFEIEKLRNDWTSPIWDRLA